MAFEKPTPNSADVGLVGLAIMGQNLVLNMADHGFQVAVYNRTTATTEKFVDNNPPKVFGDTGGGLVPGADLKDFVASIKKPRRIVILVKAGKPTDAVIVRPSKCYQLYVASRSDQAHSQQTVHLRNSKRGAAQTTSKCKNFALFSLAYVSWRLTPKNYVLIPFHASNK